MYDDENSLSNCIIWLLFRKSQHSKDTKLQPSSASEHNSTVSSCFSPLRNAKQYESQFELPASMVTGRITNHLKYESVMNSKSTGENISSGMETSKMSVFSPVLSSTVMHAPDRHERLSPIIAPSKSPEISKNVKSYQNVGLSCQESNNQQKSTPECSIFEKVTNVFYEADIYLIFWSLARSLCYN